VSLDSADAPSVSDRYVSSLHLVIHQTGWGVTVAASSYCQRVIFYSILN